MEWNWDEITRQTYIGLTPVEKGLFYLLIFASIGVSVGWYWSRLRLWRQGKPDEAVQPLRGYLGKRVWYHPATTQRKPYPSDLTPQQWALLEPILRKVLYQRKRKHRGAP